MSWQHVAGKIHGHLRDTDTRKRLNDRFASARDQLTTSIGEAAKLANISPERARYAETIGILKPGRSHENKGGAHRRYSLGELNRLIVMGDLLDNGFTLSDVAHYLNRERFAADIFVGSAEAADLTTRLREAESAYRQRMLFPRLFYFAQCLLLGDVLDCSIALVLPVEDGAADAPSSAPIPPIPPIPPITTVEDLPLIGPSLVGWHSRNHPYCVLFMHEPRMDDPTRYEIRSVDDMCREAGVAYVDDHPTGAYLLIEREFVRQLRTFPLGRARVESIPARGDTEKKHPNPRAVAYRFLRLLQQPADDANHIFGHRYSSAGDGMIYSAPEFMSDMTGDRLLSEITELVVRFGNEMKIAASSQRGRWIFSAILLPDNPSLPPGQQSLVVAAQSEDSPHILGVTRLTPGKNDGLPTLAALSGHMLMRRMAVSVDAADANAGFEEEPGPALALPIIGPQGQVLAVLYVRSKYEENTATQETFTADDQLLLRVIGHIIGGVVSGYRGNYLTRDVLVGMIEQPRTVDRFFQEFKTANAFWTDLEVALTNLMKARAPLPEGGDPRHDSAINPITLLAIDIDGHTNFVNAYGANTARHLISAVGRRIAGQPLLTSSPLMGASERSKNNLYHIYGDCFYLLLEGISTQAAQSNAKHLRNLLAGPYNLEISQTNASQTVPVATVKLEKVSVRIAVVSYGSAILNQMLTSAEPAEPTEPAIFRQAHEPTQYVIDVITSALDAGLNQGKQSGPGAIVVLDTDTGIFSPLTDASDLPPGQSRRSAEETMDGSPPVIEYRTTYP